MNEGNKSLLIYIPCHSDFDLAINQAKKIKNEFKEDSKDISRFISKIDIAISVNNFEPSKSQLDQAALVSDLIINRNKLFLADANIANGFMVGYQRKVDFLWILSANDELLESGFSKMVKSLSNEIDLLVTCLPEVSQVSSINNVIDPPMNGYSFGLISGVIYNCQTLSEFFNVSEFFIWTGWCQLSVIQNAINQKNSLKIRTVNTFEIYKQRQTKANKLANKYGHSFYGYMILGYVFAKTKKAKKKFIRHYIFQNTFKIHLYRRKSFHTSQVIDPNNYLAWNQDIAEAIIKRVSLSVYFFYCIVIRLPFYFLREFLNEQPESYES